MTLQEVLKRTPTSAEEQAWSILNREEVSYKSARLHLQTLQTNAPNIINSIDDNATRIISIAKDKQGVHYGLAIHHVALPTTLQSWPYEIAAQAVAHTCEAVCATGAKVFAVANSLSFGNLDVPKTQRFYESVVTGIANYGNAMGVTSLLENIQFDKQYHYPLASVLALGLVKADEILSAYAPEYADNYVFILVGAPTGNDTFSENRKYVSDATLGSHLLKAHYALLEELKKKKLHHKLGFQAVNRGGIALASAKLANHYGYGVAIKVENIPCYEKHLSVAQMICSETSERYLLAAPLEIADYILQHYNHVFELSAIVPQSGAVVIGELKKDNEFKAHYKNECVINFPISLLMNEMRCDRSVKARIKQPIEPEISTPRDFNDVLLKLLAHENIASHQILREYFDQVENLCLHETDIGFMQPLLNADCPEHFRRMGIAFTMSQNARFFKIDPYWGAINAVAESIRAVVATGAYPQALTHGFCLGNPEDALHMGEFSEMVCGVIEACKNFHLNTHPDVSLPVVSHDVAFRHVADFQETAFSTTAVGCVGVINDAKKAVGNVFKQTGSCILLLGERKNEGGGSVYYQLHQQLGAKLPQPDLRELEQQAYALTEIIDKKLILSARVISKGGLAVCLAKMAIPKGFGVAVEMLPTLSQDILLFGETGGFIVEVAPENLEAVEDLFVHYHCDATMIGEVTSSGRLMMQNTIDLSVAFATEAWQGGLSEKVL